jgi:hypothetical protein
MDPDLIITFRDNMKQSFGDITYHDRDISFLGMTIEPLPTGHVFVAQPGCTDKICRAEGGTRTYRIPFTATLFADLDKPVSSSVLLLLLLLYFIMSDYIDTTNFHVAFEQVSGIYMCEFGCTTKTGRKWFKSFSGQIDHYHTMHGIEPEICCYAVTDFPFAKKKKPPSKIVPGPSAQSFFSDNSSFSSKSTSSKISRAHLMPTPKNSDETVESSDEEITLGTPARSRANSEDIQTFSIILGDLQKQMAHCLATAPKAIKAKKNPVKEDAVVPHGSYAEEI